MNLSGLPPHRDGPDFQTVRIQQIGMTQNQKTLNAIMRYLVRKRAWDQIVLGHSDKIMEM